LKSGFWKKKKKKTGGGKKSMGSMKSVEKQKILLLRAKVEPLKRGLGRK